MKLAILSGASPEHFRKGAVIRLPAGSWRFHVHGLVDSELAVSMEGYEGTNVIFDSLEMCFETPMNVGPFFSKCGTEKSITVIAERINAIRNS